MQSVYTERENEFYIDYYGISFKEIKERYNWCESNYGKPYSNWRYYGSTFVFKSGEDALYFMLYWK